MVMIEAGLIHGSMWVSCGADEFPALFLVALRAQCNEHEG